MYKFVIVPSYAVMLLLMPYVILYYQRYSVAALLAENDVFERFLGRLDLQDLELQGEGESPKAAEDSQPAEGVSSVLISMLEPLTPIIDKS